jgi:hypothetical protein
MSPNLGFIDLFLQHFGDRQSEGDFINHDQSKILLMIEWTEIVLNDKLRQTIYRTEAKHPGQILLTIGACKIRNCKIHDVVFTSCCVYH